MIFETNKYHMTLNGSKVICEKRHFMVVVEGGHGVTGLRGRVAGESYFCESDGRYGGSRRELDIIGDWDSKSPERVLIPQNSKKFRSDHFFKARMSLLPKDVKRDFFIASRRLDKDGFFIASEHPRYQETEQYRTNDGSSVEFVGLSAESFRPTFYIISSKNHHLKQGDIYFTNSLGDYIGENRGLDIKEALSKFEEGKYYRTANDSKVQYLGDDNFKIIQSGKKYKARPWILNKDEVYKTTSQGSYDGFIRELDILGAWNEESI